MHRIDHATAVNGEFVKGDPAIGQQATVLTADWANGIQEEIAGVIEGAGGQLDKADNGQLLAAISALLTAREDIIKPVGSLEFMDDFVAPSTNNPRFCLATANQVLSATNWPQLVPHLRSKKLKYNAGISGEKSAFSVTNWAIATNVATLTFANATEEKAILEALMEDKRVHGSFTNWRTVTLGGAIGSVVAGTYDITGIDTDARTITFAYTATNGSGAVSTTVEFYHHRLSTASDPGGTQARHFAVQGRAFVTINDASGEVISGLRRRDRLQGHYHGSGSANASMIEFRNDGSGTYGLTHVAGNSYIGDGATGGPQNDGTNGTPRTGATTDPRSFGAVPYIWGKEYVA